MLECAVTNGKHAFCKILRHFEDIMRLLRKIFSPSVHLCKKQKCRTSKNVQNFQCLPTFAYATYYSIENLFYFC